MTKDHTQGVFIRFIDSRGELLLRASAINGVAQAKDATTHIYLDSAAQLIVELPYQTVRQINSDEPYIEIICMDSEAEIKKAD
ncbi:hypothetical protein P2S15_07410 [Escherichia coli]